MSQFQLFPSPSPARGSNNPFRKGTRKPTVNESGSPVPLDQVKASTKTESVLLQVIEDAPAAPSTPPTAPSSRTKSPGSQGKSLTSAPPGSPRHQPNQRTLPSGSPSNSSISGHDVFSTASPQSSHTASPPVLMRSIFPRFDPQLPIDKQSYHPQRTHEAPVTRARKPQLTLATPSEIDQVLGPKTVPASVLDFPAGVLEPEEIRFSSLQELEMLWEAANGQRPQDLCGTFSMRMIRCVFPNHHITRF